MQKTMLKHWIQINRMPCTSVVFGAVLFMAASAFCVHTDACDHVGDIQHSIPFGHIRNAHAQTTNQTDTTPFITTWGTTEDVPSIGFSMDVSSEGAIILWGDDSITHVSTNGVKTHEYTTTGKHTVKILGGLTHFYFSGDGDVTPELLQSVVQWGDIKWESMRHMFSNAHFMTYSDARKDLQWVLDP